MESFSSFVSSINGIVWGLPMLILILGTGIYLSIGLKGLTLAYLFPSFKLLWQSRHTNAKEGEISPFNALMTSLSATIGTGNIAGVAAAIAVGGPGALFWMWITALVGMATKYAEAVLAIRFREKNSQGQFVGGPMYYIKNGLGEKWKPLAYAFAFLGFIAAFGIGNGTQANSVAQALNNAFNIPHWLSGALLMILSGAVILGGIKRIGDVAGKLVPFMACAYVGAGLVVLIINIELIPQAFSLIFDSAFSGHAATGGFAGAMIREAITKGVARGIFSNEAGLGSAPIAHAHAQTNNPVQQGMIAMLGTFIDTIIVCSITGLAIIVSNEWTTGATGAELTSNAFNASLPIAGNIIVSVGLAVFAFTTIIGWSVYGERCFTFLFGDQSSIIFKVLFIAAIPIGAMMELKMAWLLSDTFNAFMAIPNLIALLLLSPVVFKLTNDFKQST